MMKYHLIVQNSKFTSIAYLIKFKTKHMSALSLGNSNWECSGTLIIHMTVITMWALIIKVIRVCISIKAQVPVDNETEKPKMKNINEKVETFKKTCYPPSPPAYGAFAFVCSLFLPSFFLSVLENKMKQNQGERITSKVLFSLFNIFSCFHLVCFI